MVSNHQLETSSNNIQLFNELFMNFGKKFNYMSKSI